MLYQEPLHHNIWYHLVQSGHGKHMSWKKTSSIQNSRNAKGIPRSTPPNPTPLFTHVIFKSGLFFKRTFQFGQMFFWIKSCLFLLSYVVFWLRCVNFERDYKGCYLVFVNWIPYFICSSDLLVLDGTHSSVLELFIFFFLFTYRWINIKVFKMHPKISVSKHLSFNSKIEFGNYKTIERNTSN